MHFRGNNYLYGNNHFYDFAPDGRVLEDFYYSWKRHNVCVGPLGSGKTICSIHKIFDAICEQPMDKSGVRRSRWLTIRNTENDLLGTTMRDWFEFIPQSLGRFNQKSPMTHYLEFDNSDGTPVEAEMIFLPLDMESSTKKLRGYQLTGVWCSEAKELRKSIVDMALGRLGRYPAHNDMPIVGNNRELARYWRGSVMDTNSPDDSHWIHRLIEKATPEEKMEWAMFRQPGGVILDTHGRWVPNPLAENTNNLSGDYYSGQITNRDEGWIRVNLANEYGFVSDGVPVHPEYLDHVHARDDFDYVPSLPVFVGIDYGRTPAAALFQLVNGGYRMFDEITTENMSATRFGQEMRLYLIQKYGIRASDVSGWDDPAGQHLTESSQNEQSANDLIRHEGFDVRPSPVPNKDLIRRRIALNKPLREFAGNGWPRFVVHKRCHQARAGLNGKWCYRQLQVAGEPKFARMPEKNQWSHICEAIENGLGGCGEADVAIDISHHQAEKLRMNGGRRNRARRPTYQH